MSWKCGENGVSATKLCFCDVFWGFSAYYCLRKSKAGYFQLSTLIWLVGLSLVTLPHHARFPLWCSCLPGFRSCPGLDLAREEFGALKASGCSSPNGGRGRGSHAQIFKFLLKSISEVKCQFILMNLTGWNYGFSFRNFHHFVKVCGLSVWVFKLIYGWVLSEPKKVCIDWKSLSIFNNKISFECGGWSGTFLFMYSIVFVTFGLLYGKRVCGGWVDMYKKGEVGWKWFSIFYRCLTFVFWGWVMTF